MMRGLATMVAVLGLCFSGGAQDSTPEAPTETAEEVKGVELVELRVAEAMFGAEVRIDRGSNDGLATGDLVVFYASSGESQGGVVTELDARSAVVRLNDAKSSLSLGTRGRVYVPRARLSARANSNAPAPDTELAPWLVEERSTASDPQVPTTTNAEPKSEPEWTQDMPLLAGLDPVRPRDRAQRYGGRFYTTFDGTLADTDRSDVYTRTGADVWVDNPFGRGGILHFDAEGDFRRTREADDEDETRLRLRTDRLSYSWGGNRFDRDRFQVGRFLQSGMPEFGVIDGAEFSQRRDNGDSFGASLGFMPEPDLDHKTGDDFQFAAFYHWTLDDSERFVLETGIQKTLHDGDSDRELLVSRFRYLPLEGWRANATVWIDRYGASDPVRGAGLGVTQAVVSLSKNEGLDHGVTWTLSHRELPEIDRNEYVPVLAEELAHDRTDRLSFDTWKRLDRGRFLHGHASAWMDEDDTGGDAEAGLEWRNVWHDGLRIDLTLFAGRSAYGYEAGADVSANWVTDLGRYEASYDVTRRDQTGFDDDSDNLVLHRGYLRRHWTYGSGWNLSTYVEGRLAEEETSASAGFTLQRTF